jgi:CBS domain-containing protein
LRLFPPQAIPAQIHARCVRLRKHPGTRKTIRAADDALAAEALKIFNERNIDDLIVVNAKNEPVGLVDSQDLPKLKIM